MCTLPLIAVTGRLATALWQALPKRFPFGFLTWPLARHTVSTSCSLQPGSLACPDWLRLLLLLAGDVERNPGPVTFRAPRGALDLSSGFAAAAKQKMTKSCDAFVVWLESTLQLSLPAVLSHAQSATLALRANGLRLYSEVFPRYLFVYAITAVQDRCPELKGHLTPAWQIDKK